MEIKHDLEKHRFYTVIQNQESYLEYRETDSQTWNVYYSFVPPELRGQMIAVQLVEAIVHYAREHKLRLKPTCGFVVKCFERHIEWKDVLA